MSNANATSAPPTGAPSFAEVLEQKRIVVCVGSGGVGKTTTAAALALEAARRGQRALVLTIDPARRLANSLGLEKLGHEIQRVPDELIDAAGERQPGGHLYAMMLDQKRAFDEMVERHASDPDAVKRILENPVYAQISGTLAGSQEYAAMAKVHEFDREKNFDLIVVDTPPTAHALDFLDAPQKLSSAIDSPAIEWFRALRGGRKGGRSLLGRTGAYVMKRLAKFVGSQFLEDLAVFFTEFNDILGGFQQRAVETFALFRQEKVGFVLVASPEVMAVREALFFHQRLTTSAMPFSGFVVNRVHADRPAALDRAALTERLGRIPGVAELGYSRSSLEMASEAMLDSHRELQVIAAADREAIARLRDAGGEGVLLVDVPFFKEDIHHIERLAALGRFIVET